MPENEINHDKTFGVHESTMTIGNQRISIGISVHGSLGLEVTRTLQHEVDKILNRLRVTQTTVVLA